MRDSLRAQTLASSVILALFTIAASIALVVITARMTQNTNRMWEHLESVQAAHDTLGWLQGYDRAIRAYERTGEPEAAEVGATGSVGHARCPGPIAGTRHLIGRAHPDRRALRCGSAVPREHARRGDPFHCVGLAS